MAERMSAEEMLAELAANVNSFDAKLRIIAQRIKAIENNEEIIGRTIVMHNERIKEIEQRSAGAAPVRSAASGDALEALQMLKRDTDALRSELERLRAEAVRKEEFAEVKYVVDTINPLEYVTAEQVAKIVDERVKKPK
jgi:polyhydroxyalkanoate synthesis regulator phasin